MDNKCFDEIEPAMFITDTYAVLNGKYANYATISKCISGVSRLHIQYLLTTPTGNITLDPVVQTMGQFLYRTGITASLDHEAKAMLTSS